MPYNYLYSVDLPLSSKKLIYRELTNEEQLILVKAQSMLPFEKDYLEDYARVLKNTIKGCVQNFQDLENLNVIDYILFVAKLRCISIGETVELYFSNKEEEEGDSSEIKRKKASISLNNFIKNFYELTKDSFEDKLFSSDKKISITLGWPQIKHEHHFFNFKNLPQDLFFNTLCLFLNKVLINNTIYDVSSWEYDELFSFFESLPLPLTNQIQKLINQKLTKIQKQKLFNLPKEADLHFNLYNGSHQMIMRLFFMENLQNIYEEYYSLAEKNILPQYLDKKTIAERLTYVSLLEEEKKMKKDQKTLPFK